jgi:hypothetical protein
MRRYSYEQFCELLGDKVPEEICLAEYSKYVAALQVDKRNS